jgi:hypothetical protein
MDQKQLPDDFKDFIALLNAHEVVYLLVGGWAIGIHGHPRATKDIDFLVATDEPNLERLQRALYDFGAPPLDATQFKGKNAVYRMGRPPIQIDLINKADGIDILDCYSRRTLVQVDGVDVSLISRQDLLVNKRASGRLQDLADMEKIESQD